MTKDCMICTIQEGKPFLCGDCQWHTMEAFMDSFKERHGVEFKAPVMPPMATN